MAWGRYHMALLDAIRELHGSTTGRMKVGTVRAYDMNSFILMRLSTWEKSDSAFDECVRRMAEIAIKEFAERRKASER